MKAKAILAVGLAIVITILVASMPVKAWAVSTNLHYPSTMYPGSTYSFTLDVTNTGSDSMRIENIWLGFDWQAEGVGYTNSQTPKIIGSGDTFQFAWSIPIPDGIITNTQHIAEVTIEAAGPGIIDEWGYTTTETLQFTNVFISTPESNQDPIDTTDDDDNTTPGFELPVILVATVAGVGIFAAIKRRR